MPKPCRSRGEIAHQVSIAHAACASGMPVRKADPTGTDQVSDSVARARNQWTFEVPLDVSKTYVSVVSHTVLREGLRSCFRLPQHSCRRQLW